MFKSFRYEELPLPCGVFYGSDTKNNARPVRTRAGASFN